MFIVLYLLHVDYTLTGPNMPWITRAWINRAKYALDRDLLTIVIQSLVFIKMYYCSIVWSNTTASNICKLQAVQNFAARIITNSRTFDHVTPLRCELH